MQKTIISHALFGCATAVMASCATFVALAGWPQGFAFLQAHAQTAAPAGVRITDLFKTTMTDVLGRVVSVRRFERDAGTGSPPHRHPGSHTIGYVLEGVYELKVDDGPLQRLGPG